MEISIHFQDGPIEAEITANEEEPYDEVLESLEEFLDGYQAIGIIEEETGNEGVEQESPEPQSTKSAAGTTAESDNPLVANTGVSEGDIQRILKLGRVEDGNVEEFPVIIGNSSVLGDSISQRLLHGAAIILTIIEDYHGAGRVKTTDLKEALNESGLDDSNWGNMTSLDEADVYFNRRGTGSSATIKIREPGKEDAYREIEKLAADLRGEPVNED